MFWVSKQSKIEIEEMQLVVDFLSKHLVQLEEKQENINSDIFEVTRFFILEFVDTYKSISTLYTKNHFKSCLVLARSIFEGAINLEYIYKSPDVERCAKNYRLFSIREYLARTKKYESEDVSKSELINLLRVEVEEYNPFGKDNRYWDGKNVRDKAIEIEDERAYDRFKQLSNYNHGNFRTSNDFSTGRPYTDFLHEVISRDTVVSILSALQEVAVKLELEGGVMVIKDYPKKGENVIWPTNPNRLKEIL